MDEFYSHVVKTTDSALSLEDERERQATFQSLNGYLKERMQLLFPSERGDTQTGQGQEEVAALERSSEENNRDETTISPFQQMVWRLEKPKYFLGIIYLLATELPSALVSSDSCAKKNVIDSISYFLRQYTPDSSPDTNCMREQARYAPWMFRKLSICYAAAMREEGRAIEAIAPLQAAVEMSRPASETIVPIEVELLLCFITAKMYGAGARWVDAHLPLRVSPNDALHYFRSVQDADHVCEYYINGVTMEAYKKSILVGLIISGVVPDIPDMQYEYGMQNRFTSVLPYLSIAKGYASGDTIAMGKAIADASSVLEADGNMGLAKSAKAALIRRKIYCLKYVYVTVSLSCIATQVGVSSTEEVENQILSLVESGEIAAVIDHSSGMVTFDKEDWETHNRSGMLSLIEKDIKLTMELIQRVNSFAGHGHAQESTSRSVMK